MMSPNFCGGFVPLSVLQENQLFLDSLVSDVSTDFYMPLFAHKQLIIDIQAECSLDCS